MSIRAFSTRWCQHADVITFLLVVKVSSPKDGLPLANPLSKSMWSEVDADKIADDDEMPIGSLRFLRSQVELECE
jgi:hypothetical protein